MDDLFYCRSRRCAVSRRIFRSRMKLRGWMTAASRPASRADKIEKRRSVTAASSIVNGTKSKTCSAVSKIGDAFTPAMTNALTPSCPPSESPQPPFSRSDKEVLDHSKASREPACRVVQPFNLSGLTPRYALNMRAIFGRIGRNAR